ncbi:MAG TPA: hypothetical protein VH110_05265 [Candidatus Acidoferrum sp.]|jgi:hypothetical protein|nr:hypothetical protein [Candidatus Acidoferrum sp.]
MKRTRTSTAFDNPELTKEMERLSELRWQRSWMGSQFMIEARGRNVECRAAEGPSDLSEWQPVSLKPPPTRLYHYSSREEAERALGIFLEAEDGLAHLIVRLASGQRRVGTILEFRIVQVRVLEDKQ